MRWKSSPWGLANNFICNKMTNGLVFTEQGDNSLRRAVNVKNVTFSKLIHEIKYDTPRKIIFKKTHIVWSET